MHNNIINSILGIVYKLNALWCGQGNDRQLILRYPGRVVMESYGYKQPGVRYTHNKPRNFK